MYRMEVRYVYACMYVLIQIRCGVPCYCFDIAAAASVSRLQPSPSHLTALASVGGPLRAGGRHPRSRRTLECRLNDLTIRPPRRIDGTLVQNHAKIAHETADDGVYWYSPTTSSNRGCYPTPSPAPALNNTLNTIVTVWMYDRELGLRS